MQSAYDSYYDLIVDTYKLLGKYHKENKISIDINTVEREMAKVIAYCNGKCNYPEIGQSLYYLFSVFHNTLNLDISIIIDLSSLNDYVTNKKSYTLYMKEYSYSSVYKVLINTLPIKYIAVSTAKIQEMFTINANNKKTISDAITIYSSINNYLGQFLNEVVNSKGVFTNQYTLLIPEFNFNKN